MKGRPEWIKPSFEHRREDELPEGWTYVALGNVGTWGTGGTPSKSRTDYWTNGTVPWVSPKDMKVSYISSAQDLITRRAADEAAKLVPEGTILFVVRGMILAHTFPVALTTREVAFNQDMRSIVPHPAVYPPYLLRLLQHEAMGILFAVKEATHGTLRLDSDTLLPWPIPLPPLPEQRRIVEKVEALLADANAARERLAKVPLILKRFRQAVLAAACSGRLTEEWREAQGLVADPSMIEGAALDCDLAALPDQWRWARMEQVADIRGGIQKQPKRAPKHHAFPYLRVANVLRGRLDLSQVELMELFGNELETYRLEPGDLLIVEGNGSLTEIGRSAVWSGAVPDCVHQNHIIRVRPRQCVPEFLDQYWNSPLGTAQVSSVAVTTSGLFSLSTRKIAALPVPVPPRAEQSEIVRRVEALFAVADAVEERVKLATARAEKLPQAILSKAFLGELVPTEAELARAERRGCETAEEMLRKNQPAHHKVVAKPNGSRKSPSNGRVRQDPW